MPDSNNWANQPRDIYLSWRFINNRTDYWSSKVNRIWASSSKLCGQFCLYLSLELSFSYGSPTLHFIKHSWSKGIWARCHCVLRLVLGDTSKLRRLCLQNWGQEGAWWCPVVQCSFAQFSCTGTFGKSKPSLPSPTQNQETKPKKGIWSTSSKKGKHRQYKYTGIGDNRWVLK